MILPQLCLLLAPVGHRLFAEVRRAIERDLSEIQDSRRLNNIHFDGEQLVIEIDQSRNRKSMDRGHVSREEPLVTLNLDRIDFRLTQDLERCRAGGFPNGSVGPSSQGRIKYGTLLAQGVEFS